MAALLNEGSTTDPALDRKIFASLSRSGNDSTDAATWVRSLIADDLDDLPLPASGSTLLRWRALAEVARFDLATAKLFESHTDALAILREIDHGRPPRHDRLHAVWAAEAPSARLRIKPAAGLSRIGSEVVVDGSKAWCSGAKCVDVGLVTVFDADEGRWLVEVAMDQSGITIIDDRWRAIGMEHTGTADLLFEGVAGRVVGRSNAYLERAGFWHGGGGIAACWFGAAAAIGTKVRELQRGRKDVHARAHLGTIDARLAAMAALIRECAGLIDADPTRDVRREVLRLRAAVVDGCERVLREALHAIGPGPFCADRSLARHAADLPIFMRQMRAEHDLVAQANAVLMDDEFDTHGWAL